MSRTQRLLVILGLVISAVFLWVAFQGLNPAEVWVQIRQANVWLLLLGAVWYFAAVTIISLRWKFLLRAVKDVALTGLIPLVCIGYMGNNVYPLRSGELLRIWLAQRNFGVPLARGATTVVVERIFDGIVMLSFIVVALLFLDNSSPQIRNVTNIAAPIFVAAVVIFFVLAAQPNILRQLVALVSSPLPGRIKKAVTHLSEEFIAGLKGLQTPADLAGAVFASYLTWGLEATVYWLVSFAFGFDLSYFDMLLVVGVVNLAGLIPASPGQIGVFEFFVAAVLIGQGIDEAQATAYALVVHVVIWLPVTVVGFIFLVRQGLGWQAITRARDLEQQVSPSTGA